MGGLERISAAHRPPLGVLAHLAGCDGCTAVALESSLRRAPAIAIPPAFAADVARRARLETPLKRLTCAASRWMSVSAGVLVGIVVAWLGLSGSSSGVVSAAVLLFSCGEAIVLAAWTLAPTSPTRAGDVERVTGMDR